jgi:hypothetical protein
VRAGIEHLKERDATVIGLETMPRNFRNIGFYSKLGFDPGPLCLDLVSQTHDGRASVDTHGAKILYLRDSTSTDREKLLRDCGKISGSLSPGLDYSAEILLNMEHRFGDTVVLVNKGRVTGFAICHLEPYGQFEERRELKVNVLAMRPEPATGGTAPATAGKESAGKRARREPGPAEECPDSRAALDRLSALLTGVKDLAARENLSVVRLHLRSDKWVALRSLLSWGYSVGYSDLRMCLSGFVEEEPADWFHFCRWQ